jgi:uncharacterized membrane protein
MSQLLDINFWASVVTIVSIFFALFVFWDDKKEKSKGERELYLNQLNSLKFELEKNYKVILGFFARDSEGWSNGQKIAYYRYSTGVTNKLIVEGLIQDRALLRNIDAISDNQNQVNRLLDLITLMTQTSQIGSQAEREMFQQRITDASLTLLSLNDQILQYMPKVITDLDAHINQLKS